MIGFCNSTSVGCSVHSSTVSRYFSSVTCEPDRGWFTDTTFLIYAAQLPSMAPDDRQALAVQVPGPQVLGLSSDHPMNTHYMGLHFFYQPVKATLTTDAPERHTRNKIK